MRPVIIVYSSLHGQTLKIAARIAHRLRAAGRAVELHDARHPPDAAALGRAAGVVVGSWVIGGRHRGPVLRFVRRHRAALAALPGAFYSVSLLQRSPREESRRRAADYVPRFVRETGWQPPSTAVFAGALTFTRWGWLRRRLMRAIWRREGIDPDLTRDHEYTDWPAVDRFADDVLARVREAELSAGPARAAASTR